MIRVLHIASGNLYGGVETLLTTLARRRELCPSMTPEFAVCHRGRLTEELTDSGAKVHDLGEVRVRRPLSIQRARCRLRDLLNSERYDAAVCHMPWTQAIFGPAVGACNVPLAFWSHSATDGKHWLERWASHIIPDLVLAPSRFAAEAARRLYPNAQCYVLLNPVELPAPLTSDERRKIRSELETSDNSVVVIQASRMEAWKGHRVLLEGLGSLRANLRWTCWIAGDAQRPQEEQYRQTLHETAARSGIADRVHFVGERRDVPRLMGAADLYCQPNTVPEPFGIAFVEALGAGIPVIATQIGGALDIVNHEVGRLVEANSSGALSRALNELITSDELRRRLAEAAPARAHLLSDPATQMMKLSTRLSSLTDLEADAGGAEDGGAHRFRRPRQPLVQAISAACARVHRAYRCCPFGIDP